MPQSKYTLWRERFGLEMLRRLAEDGYTDEEMATACSVELPLFRLWRNKYPEFEEAIRLGRSESDIDIIKSLYKKATGYNVSLKKTYKLKRVEFDPDTGKKVREYEELATGIDESHVPPDLRAETFWLTNRQGERWSEDGQREAVVDEDGEGGVVELPSADSIDEPEDEVADKRDDG